MALITAGAHPCPMRYINVGGAKKGGWK